MAMTSVARVLPWVRHPIAIAVYAATLAALAVTGYRSVVAAAVIVLVSAVMAIGLPSFFPRRRVDGPASSYRLGGQRSGAWLVPFVWTLLVGIYLNSRLGLGGGLLALPLLGGTAVLLGPYGIVMRRVDELEALYGMLLAYANEQLRGVLPEERVMRRTRYVLLGAIAYNVVCVGWVIFWIFLLSRLL